MQIDRDYLVTLREKAEGQRLRLLSEIHQAVGAIAVLDAMLSRLEADEPKEGAGDVPASTLRKD